MAAEIPDGFEKYAGTPKLHEAGYDSFIAAKALIRLSANSKEMFVSDDSLPATGMDGHVSQGARHSGNASQAHEPDLGTLPPASQPDLQALEDENRFRHLALEESEDHLIPKQAKLLMPSKGSRFWSKFVNNLRVNGTLEGVCNIPLGDDFKEKQ